MVVNITFIPENKEIPYKIYYTTDANPAQSGIDGMKACSWSTTQPADLASVTAIKVVIDEIGEGTKCNFAVSYKLGEDKSEVGTQVDEQVVYNTNLTEKDDQSSIVQAISAPMSFILTDMKVSGIVWDDTASADSVYTEGTDKLYEGMDVKLLNADGSLYDTRTTDENGAYSFDVPNDNEYTVVIDVPEGMHIVNKQQGDSEVSSVFNPDTGMTDATAIPSDYVTKSGEWQFVNVGLYTMPKITAQDLVMHVGSSKTETAKVTSGEEVLPDDYTITYVNAEDENIASINSNSDNTAAVNGDKTGVTKAKATVIDKYGNEISADYSITVYANVLYDVTTNGGSGKVTDSNDYYPSSDSATDLVTVKTIDGVTLPKKSVFIGWNTKADGTGTSYQPNATFNTGSIPEDITLYAQYEKLFSVDYQWSGDIPADAVLPTDTKDYHWHDKTTADGTYTAMTSIIGDLNGVPGVYTFSGWDASDDPDLTADGMEGDVTYKGTWTFTADTYTVTYVADSDTTWGAPEDAQLPVDSTVYDYKQTVTVAEDMTTTQDYAVAANGDHVPGVWTFTTWDKEDFQITEDTTITGAWTFTANTYKVEYAVNGDKTYGMPQDFKAPIDPTEYNYKDLVKVADALVSSCNYAMVDGKKVIGTWKFVAWDKEDFQITGDTVITGAWQFTPDKTSSQPQGPQTGDNSNLALWYALLFGGAIALTATVVFGRKKRAE